MNYRTLADMAALIRSNIHRIPRVDCVVGIPRSGMIAAGMIATLTNQKLRTLSQLGGATLESILLVDDSIAGGETMQHALKWAMEWNPKATITTLAVFIKSVTHQPNIYFELVPGPRVFEWNWHRSKYLPSAILDIDGVISTPTNPGEREKGRLLYRPARAPLALATGRWECDRDATTNWLRQNGIEYGRLFMSGEARRGQETKVQACELFKPKWFVESSAFQAEYIRARTRLPVLCVDSNVML